MEKKRLLIWILLIIAFVFLLAPFVYTISCSIPVSDDFKMAFIARQYSGQSLAGKAKEVANFFYMNWGASWADIFLQVLINPLLVFLNPLRKIGYEMVFFFLMLVASIMYLIHCVLKYVFCCDNAVVRALAELSIVSAVLVSDTYYQVFYWFTGSMYNWFLCFALIFTATLIRESAGKSKVFNRIAMLFFGVLACQVMCMDIPLGALMLAAIVYGVKNKRNNTKMLVLMLCLMILSGVSSVIAPGNYKRYSGDIGDVSILWCIKNTILISIDEALAIFKNRAVTAYLALVFCAGTFLKKKGNKAGHIAVLLLLMGFSLFGAFLPVDIGYGGGPMPNRINYLFNVIFIVYFSTVLLMLGSCIGKRAKKWTCICILTIAVALLAVNGGYKDSAHYKTAIHAAEAKAESEGYKAIYREIEQSEDGDVVIVIDPDSIPCSGIIAPPNITGSADDYVNIGVAQYYGKNSLRFEWK